MNRPHIVGILNITPDSFYDGGKFLDGDSAVQRALALIGEGADILEIGGESTGPHSPSLPVEEELNRTINVIRKMKELKPNSLISIDTYKHQVAEEAIRAGAGMVNDVTAGRSDPLLLSIVAKAGVPIVLMYSKDSTPRTTIAEKRYDDVVRTVKDFLRERKQAAIDAGVDPSKIILDPGLGHFISSIPDYSFQILARLRELEELGSPLFVSPSRKSFLAGAEKLPTQERLPGTIAASVIAMQNGATYIRTHDVREVRRALEIAGGIEKLRING